MKRRVAKSPSPLRMVASCIAGAAAVMTLVVIFPYRAALRIVASIFGMGFSGLSDLLGQMVAWSVVNPKAIYWFLGVVLLSSVCCWFKFEVNPKVKYAEEISALSGYVGFFALLGILVFTSVRAAYLVDAGTAAELDRGATAVAKHLHNRTVEVERFKGRCVKGDVEVDAFSLSQGLSAYMVGSCQRNEEGYPTFGWSKATKFNLEAFIPEPEEKRGEIWDIEEFKEGVLTLSVPRMLEGECQDLVKRMKGSDWTLIVGKEGKGCESALRFGVKAQLVVQPIPEHLLDLDAQEGRVASEETKGPRD